MPFRLTEKYQGVRAKIQFTTSADMPYQIWQACVATGTRSNTVYIQKAVCEALSRDLGIPLEDLYAKLPIPLANSGHLYHPDDNSPVLKRRVDNGTPWKPGSGSNSEEEVR